MSIVIDDVYVNFESIDNVGKSPYVLGSELWERTFDGLLSLVKECCRRVGNTQA